ncbi:MAG: hypothetical protein SOT68_02075 [Oscillospiraceae bacterium]|nr:hypothetical protein [Oscillospiraceae bacterium]
MPLAFWAKAITINSIIGYLVTAVTYDRFLYVLVTEHNALDFKLGFVIRKLDLSVIWRDNDLYFL